MKNKIYIMITVLSIVASCNTKTTNSDEVSREKRVVLVDSTFNNYFLPKGDAYTGGDGAYSVLLPDGRTVWIWGDTFLGNVTENFERIKTSPLYIRNCFTTIESDGNLKTIHQGEPAEFKSMMIPPEVEDGSAGKNELELWYWPGDGFIENGRLKLFLSKFAQVEKGMWGFEFQETELFEFSLPNYEIVERRKFENLDGAHLGHAVCPTLDYTYIYGLKGQFPHVARAKSGKIGENWEYLADSGWSENATDAKPMIEFSGSEQFSVFEWEETYVMIMQEGGFGTGIYSFTSTTPYGPWTNETKLYDTPEISANERIFTYNAMAHPQYTEDDMLLISYNTNSMELQDHYDDALIYRPRFIRVPLELILQTNTH